MNGDSLLDDVERWLRTFVAYPSKASVTAHALWIAHTHVINAFENTPRLAFLSPEPGSGKSRALEVTEPLVPRPIITVNATAAYVFRKISDPEGLPTLLMDEIDAIFTSRPSEGSEELRGLLNSGYRRGATAGRAAVRGKEVVTEDWPSFSPVAMAGLNSLPDTLMTRSIVVRMQRRRPTDVVLPYRRRVYRERAEKLHSRLAAWANLVRTDLEDVWPDLPDGIEDRDADVWEPLIAVADAAGGNWPQRARDAAVAMVKEAKATPVTLGIRLLTDIKRAFGSDHRLSTHELLDRLHELEDAPWASIKGEPINARFLAYQVAKYGIPTNKTLRVQGTPAKGYEAADFLDAWSRYVPTPPGEDGNSSNSGDDDQEADHLDSFEPEAVTGVTGVTELRARRGAA